MLSRLVQVHYFPSVTWLAPQWGKVWGEVLHWFSSFSQQHPPLPSSPSLWLSGGSRKPLLQAALSHQACPAGIFLFSLSLCGILLSGMVCVCVCVCLTVIPIDEPGGKETCRREFTKGVRVLEMDSEGKREGGGWKKMPAGKLAFLEQSAATARADRLTKAHGHLFRVTALLFKAVHSD